MSKSRKITIKPVKQLKQSKASLLEQLTDEWVGVEQKSILKNISNDGLENLNQGKSNAVTRNKQLPLIEESRFTIVIPTYLHTRIKKHCAINSIPMKALLTEILLKEFPER